VARSLPQTLPWWPQSTHGDAPFLVDAAGVVDHRRVFEEALALRVDGSFASVVSSRCDRRSIVEIVACWLRGSAALVLDEREPATLRASTERLAAALPRSAWSAATVEERCAVVLRTSGSSGTPKFAVHRHASLVANALASARRTPFGPGHRWLLSLSPHHIGGLSIIVRAMVGGAAVRLGRGPGGVLDDLRDDADVTHVSLVATQLRRLLASEDRGAVDRRMRSLAAILVGGGPIPAALRSEAIDRGWPVFATYGLTEAASQVSIGPLRRGAPADDAGRPLDGVKVAIDATGEIVVRGPTVFAGYLRETTPGSAAIERPAGGVLRTGDRGRIESDGSLCVEGRLDSMFISGGENIQPEEIESVLRDVPGIEQACVVAIDDPEWQRRPIAFVAGSFAVRDLLRVLDARLPRFKWPDRIHPMPRDDAERAKPRRGELAAAARRGDVAEPLWTRPQRSEPT
jgi:O-succinylbenzoic acid--CoA ligase